MSSPSGWLLTHKDMGSQPHRINPTGLNMMLGNEPPADVEGRRSSLQFGVLIRVSAFISEIFKHKTEKVK